MKENEQEEGNKQKGATDVYVLFFEPNQQEENWKVSVLVPGVRSYTDRFENPEKAAGWAIDVLVAYFDLSTTVATKIVREILDQNLRLFQDNSGQTVRWGFEQMRQ